MPITNRGNRGTATSNTLRRPRGVRPPVAGELGTDRRSTGASSRRAGWRRSRRTPARRSRPQADAERHPRLPEISARTTRSMRCVPHHAGEGGREILSWTSRTRSSTRRHEGRLWMTDEEEGHHSSSVISRSLRSCSSWFRGVDHALDLAVHEGGHVVHGEADAMVRDAALREVVGADLLASGPRSRSAPCAGRSARRSPRPASSGRAFARRTSIALSLFCAWERSSWQVLTRPVGLWMIRIAVSFFCMCWPPAEEEQKVEISSSLGSIVEVDLRRPRGARRRWAMLVWMRPLVSVCGHALDAVAARIRA